MCISKPVREADMVAKTLQTIKDLYSLEEVDQQFRCITEVRRDYLQKHYFVKKMIKLTTYSKDYLREQREKCHMAHIIVITYQKLFFY